MTSKIKPIDTIIIANDAPVCRQYATRAPEPFQKLAGETWRDVVARVAGREGLAAECLEIFDRTVKSGDTEMLQCEAAWSALWDWDCLPLEAVGLPIPANGARCDEHESRLAVVEAVLRWMPVASAPRRLAVDAVKNSVQRPKDGRNV